jgi:hypothetical protein
MTSDHAGLSRNNYNGIRKTETDFTEQFMHLIRHDVDDTTSYETKTLQTLCPSDHDG